jgi:hypothetical protein
MWLRNKFCFAVVVVHTKITRFWIKMNHKVSHLKGFHRTTPAGSGAQTFTEGTKTFLLPPTIPGGPSSLDQSNSDWYHFYLTNSPVKFGYWNIKQL